RSWIAPQTPPDRLQHATARSRPPSVRKWPRTTPRRSTCSTTKAITNGASLLASFVVAINERSEAIGPNTRQACSGKFRTHFGVVLWGGCGGGEGGCCW